MSYRQVKRALDFLFSFLLLAVLSPLIGLLVAASLVIQGRPVFFIQTRPGLDDEPFKLIKFRTMAALPAKRRAQTGNSVTPFGRFLRALSLDEIPQLLNILRGEMSFIGPRPLLVEYLSRYSETERSRHKVRPGLTGLAQVEGRNLLSWEEKFRLDVMYVQKVSFSLDLKIALRTIFTVATGRGVEAEGAPEMQPFMGNPNSRFN